MRNRWFAVVSLLIGTAAALRAASDPLNETRSTVNKWVEARQLATTSANEWQAEKETIDASIRLYEQELRDIEAKREDLDSGSSEIQKERSELEMERDRLQGVLEKAKELLGPQEARVKRLASSLPRPLVEKIEPLVQRIPDDPDGTRMSVAERLQTLVGILNEIDKFNGSVNVVSEIQKNADGREVQVETMYLGLAQAYFVGESGRFAGVGMPGGNGWTWREENSLANAIQKAIAVHRNQQPAAFVSLPVVIK